MRQLPVVPICRMGSRLRRRANQNHLPAHPASMKRDVRAIVTTREAGMRWTRMARETNVACADGEVVWSRPPDAEAKVARSSRGRRGQESPVPGESAKETVKTIAQGMPVDLAKPVVLPPAFFVAGGPWVRPSPGIPCALFVSRGRSYLQHSGANASRDRVGVFTSKWYGFCVAI
jgi:hypothetical protein